MVNVELRTINKWRNQPSSNSNQNLWEWTWCACGIWGV